MMLQDIPEWQMSLLLDYMYRGCLSVKQDSLASILQSASALHIRGLTTAEAPR